MFGIEYRWKYNNDIYTRIFTMCCCCCCCSKTEKNKKRKMREERERQIINYTSLHLHRLQIDTKYVQFLLRWEGCGYATYCERLKKWQLSRRNIKRVLRDIRRQLVVRSWYEIDGVKIDYIYGFIVFMIHVTIDAAFPVPMSPP